MEDAAPRCLLKHWLRSVLAAPKRPAVQREHSAGKIVGLGQHNRRDPQGLTLLHKRPHDRDDEA